MVVSSGNELTKSDLIFSSVAMSATAAKIVSRTAAWSVIFCDTSAGASLGNKYSLISESGLMPQRLSISFKGFKSIFPLTV